MLSFKRIRGTLETFFQVGGNQGPGLVSLGTTQLGAYQADAATLAVVSGADPTGTNDFVTLEFLGRSNPQWDPAVKVASFAMADPATLTAARAFRVDPSGGAIVATLPNNPADGTTAVIKVVGNINGNFAAFAVSFLCQGGDKIEQYAAAPSGAGGTLSIVLGVSATPQIGQTQTVVYDRVNTLWRLG